MSYRRASWIERREEDFFGWLVERESRKNPGWWEAGYKPRGWEHWVLIRWPRWLTVSWWVYLFDRGGDRWRRKTPWINLWRPIGDWSEFRYWLRFTRKFMFEETMVERIACRIKGHPNGEIFYNPGGDEPDHRCKDCGEEIG